MSKRKRGTTNDTSRPNKRRRKNKTNSPSLSSRDESVESSNNNNNNNKNILLSTNNKLPQRGKKQICPKAAFQQLPKQQDHLLFFNLLSKTKRPKTKFEWDLMAQTFIHNGSNKVNGQTLYNFYKVLCENGSIHDKEFVDSYKNNKNNKNKPDITEYKMTINCNIDFSSKLYQTAYSKFMQKLCQFNKIENIQLIKIEDKCIDLFYFYILITKHGGFNNIKSWINILYQMSWNFNPHSKYFIINELKLMYKKYLYQYEETYFQSDLIDNIVIDDFGDDLYLEDCVEIVNILTKYPLKLSVNNNDNQNDSYWLEMMPNGNNIQTFMFGNAIQTNHNLSYHRKERQIICVNGSDKKELLNRLTVKNDVDCQDDNDNDDDDESIESVIKSMVYHNDNIEIIDDDEDIISKQYEYISKHLSINCVKGMHPFTRQLIFKELSKECDSETSLNQIENITLLSQQTQKTTTNNPRKTHQTHKRHKNNNNNKLWKKSKSSSKSIGKEMYKLTEYEINYIIDELIIKMLTMNCCLNDGETSMIMAIENGLNLLKSQYENDKDGYSLYHDINNNCTYYIYYKRILSSFEKFAPRAIKRYYEFLAHPKGLGINMISNNFIIKKGTFLSEMYGELYSISRWIEHTFCVSNLHYKLQSAYPLFDDHPFIIEYIDNKTKKYNILSILNNNNNQITQCTKYINSGGNKHWTSKLNHSCQPNCCIKPFIHKNKIRLGLFTICNIKKGDELTINYKWFSNDDKKLCQESICLCGLSNCNKTFIKWKDPKFENKLYLNKNHKYIDRLVNLLNSTIKPLTNQERKELNKLCIKPDKLFGDWLFKYFAFLSKFIQDEYKNLPQQLLIDIDKDDEYTLIDAKNDAKEILLRRIRALSITMERIKYYLKKQEKLFKQIIKNNKNNYCLNINNDSEYYLPKYIQLFAQNDNTLFVPPIRFAEIDEIIGRLWNDSDSLINRLLDCLKNAISFELYNMILNIVKKCGLMEESQFGLHSIRRKFIQICKILKEIKCNKINRHHACADILYLYANTYRFFKTQSYLSFASQYSDFGIISNYRDVKKIDNRYKTRSVRKEGSDIDDDFNNDDDYSDHDHYSEQCRYIYSSSFPFKCLLGWYHHCSLIDPSSINGELINKYIFNEYYENIFGNILLPDIESCYDENCKGNYLNTHRKYIFNAIEKKKNWMNQNYTKQYENADKYKQMKINSCPVPQFTFKNKTQLFGSPVFDTYFDGFDNTNNKYLKNIINGLQNGYTQTKQS